MHKLLLALLVAGIAAAPQFASADEMKSDAMSASAPMMVCRHAAASEKATAMMGTTGLVCKDVDMKKMMAGPDMTNVKTMSDANKAWHEFLAGQLNGTYAR